MAYARIDSITPRVTLNGESTLSIRASAVDYTGALAVRYRASIEVGGVSWTYPSQSVDGNFSFAPDIGLMEGFTDSAEAEATVTVEMVSAAGSLGASGTAKITLAADEALARPVPTEGWVNLSPYNGNTHYPGDVYVKGSRVQAAFDVSKIEFKYGAGAANIENGRWAVRIGGKSAVTDGIMFSGNSLTMVVPAAGEVEVTCTVTDSRGFSASETFAITAREYAQPVLSGIEIYRSDASGSAGDTGTFIRVKADAGISGLGGSNEIIEFYVEFSPTGSGTVTRTDLESGAPVLLGAGSVVPARSYRIGIYLLDGCGGSAEYTTIVSTVSAALSILPGGKGAALGRLAEKEKTLDVYDWDIITGGKISAANVYPVGSVYMSAYEADPAELYGGTWSQVTSTGLPFNVWFRNG